MAEVQEFSNDDEAYQQWRGRNSGGFIINARRSKTSSYMVLHSASCPMISNYTQMAQPGGFTERQYIKICAADVESLIQWVRQHGRPDGSFTKECAICNPPG